MDYSLLGEDSNAPFGEVVPLSNESLSIHGFQGYSFVQFKGNGYLDANGQRIALLSPDTFSWHPVPGPFGTSTKLSGNINVSAIVVSKVPLIVNQTIPNPTQHEVLPIVVGSPSAVVFARTFARGFVLTSPTQSLSPSATIDGLTIFSDVTSGTYTVSFPSINTALASYIIALGFIFSVIGISVLTWLRKVKIAI